LTIHLHRYSRFSWLIKWITSICNNTTTHCSNIISISFCEFNCVNIFILRILYDRWFSLNKLSITLFLLIKFLYQLF
jgi:hypothetical protein